MSRKPQKLSRKLNGKVLGIKCHDKLENKLCWGKPQKMRDFSRDN